MKPQYVRGAAYYANRLRCWMYLMRRALDNKRYPLHNISSIGQAIRMMNDIKVDRWIKWKGRYRQTLVTPLWPSPLYDRMLEKGGLNLDTPGDASKRCWVDLAMVAMTRRCSIGTCEHCSERYNLGKTEKVPIESLHDVVEFLQERGTGVIAFTGGEPFDTPDRLLELVEKGDNDKSEFRVYTTGKGVTAEWAKKLAAAGLDSALVSIDGPDEESHDGFRRKQGVFHQSLEAMRLFLDAGIFVFGNVTLTSELVRSGKLRRLWELMRDLGVPALQMIEPKTCGGYLKDNPETLFSLEDIELTRKFVEEVRREKEDGPVVYWVDEEERAIGCRAGGMLMLYVDSVGNVQPCVFLPVSFGNILEEDFATIFGRMRKVSPDATHQGCLTSLLAPSMQRLFNEGVKMPIPVDRLQAEYERIYGVEWNDVAPEMVPIEMPEVTALESELDLVGV